MFRQSKDSSSILGLGASPDGGTTWLLPRLVGSQRARKFFFGNEVWSANESLQAGAVDEVTQLEKLIRDLLKWLRIGEGGRTAVGLLSS